jgi:hypothetical protein
MFGLTSGFFPPSHPQLHHYTYVFNLLHYILICHESTRTRIILYILFYCQGKDLT